jgi:UDP-N-acetylmuramate--alanine ligase
VNVALQVPGRHNVDNAAAVAVWALESGYTPEQIATGLAQFRGAPRRFTVVGTRGRTQLIDDYAHLPREVSATIAAARAGGFTRLGVIFQPHRVTRTRLLAPTFSGAFTGVEKLIVTDVYRSGEPAEAGVDGSLIVNAVRGDVPDVTYVPALDEARALAEEWFDDLDAIIVMGAGDVAEIAAQWSDS